VSCSNNCATIESYTIPLTDSSSGNIPSCYTDQIIAQMWSNEVRTILNVQQNILKTFYIART